MDGHEDSLKRFSSSDPRGCVKYPGTHAVFDPKHRVWLIPRYPLTMASRIGRSTTKHKTALHPFKLAKKRPQKAPKSPEIYANWPLIAPGTIGQKRR